MGLDTSHDCWHGAYSEFMRWRREIAHVAGMPPLDLMEGFYCAIPGDDYQDPIYWAKKGLNDEKAFDDLKRRLPIKWECLNPSPLHILLNHSDCDGEIAHKDCLPIALALEALIPNLPAGEDLGHIGNWRDKTSKFVKGLKLAHSRKENVIFH